MSTIVGALFLASLLGYVVGRIATVQFAQGEVRSLVLHQEDRKAIPVLHIDGIRDGLLRGTMEGEFRMFLGEEPVLPDGSGAFAVVPDFLLVNDVTILVPEGMQFVASKKGTRYYPVFSRQGEQILPGNRVYFSTAAEAQAAGFTTSVSAN